VAGGRAALDGEAGPREIVGREEELERIARFVESEHGRAAALVVEGHAGIGKTTLWNEGIRLLDSSGFRVLRTTAAAAEADISLSALTDLLGPVYPVVRADLPAPQRHALDVALALEDPAEDASQGGRVLAAATLGSLRALSELGPVAVAVDDTQWVDRESAAALSYALRRLGTLPVVCLFSERLGTPSAFDLDELGDLALERMNVGPLSLGATQRLLSNELGVTYARPIIRRVVETSGGNPFYARELAFALERAAEPASDEQPALSEKLDDLISGRLAGLSGPASELLGFLSLLPSATVGWLESLGVLDALDETVAAGIVRVDGADVRFSHPLLAAGAFARLGPEKRRRCHAALASVLDDPVERARHLAHASIPPAPEAAEEIALAAMLALGRGVPAIGARLSEDAVRLTPETDARSARTRRLFAARCHAQAGSFDRARELLDGVLPELRSGDERADALALRGKVTADITTQRELLLQALEDTDDPSIHAGVNALLVRNFLYTGELDEALAAARAGDEQASRTGDERRVAAATTTLGLMQIWGTGAPDPVIYRRAQGFAATAAELPAETYSNPHTLIGARALYRYELDQARQSYELAAAAAEVAGEVDSLETFWWGLAQLEVRAGRYAAAHDYVQRILGNGEPDERRPLSVRWIEGLLAVYDGNAEDARRLLEESIAIAADGANWFFDAYGRSALAFLDLSLGEPQAALATLDPVLSTRFVLEGDPGQTGILPLAAEAAVAVRELERAADIVAFLQTRGRELDHAWCLASAARCRGLLLVERGVLEDAFRAFDEALELHADVPAPFERARTMLALGWSRRRARQRRAARESLEQAASIFEELGTPLWLGRARDELARIGGRASSRGELTPNERRIAALVGEGKTNKEVAAALFVTDRTVESALTQIYRKLDVRSRTELARKLE
jgi:DNA-binding CsgD family transcriptional regulator/tetratricopeptide (TPR) repeat protein